MKTIFKLLLPSVAVLVQINAMGSTLYVDSQCSSPTAPYTSWATAAANIQDAIDAAVTGDVVLVTNGIYATGGKVMAGDLTNRVAIDKAITVQSVNGPWVTTIRGAGATNGLVAVRCAWVTNGATLQGFTLTAGATRTSGDQTNLLNGGGALCLNTNALLRNCLVISNVAQTYGGGVFQGVIANSALLGNRATTSGSGAAYATLSSCTVVSNWGNGVFQSRATNCILYYNSSGNYGAGTLAYSCTQPAPGGVGNITTAPQLFVDAIHLLETSPCRNVGTNLTTGTDIDGQAWNNPPSIGCDEWRNEPVIVFQPRIQQTIDPIGFNVAVTAAGSQPFICYWTHNGTLIGNNAHFSQANSTTLVATGISSLDTGLYQVVVSNAFGMVTSAMTQLTIRYADIASASPTPPYTSWTGAATNIQDAIDAAVDGDLILVTNGIYSAGGRVMAGDLTNRVAVTKAVAVRSVNGPWATMILGVGSTNGTAAVRCAWLTNGAILQGFTLTAGATRTAGDTSTLRSGGGVWCASTNAIVTHCVIRSNTGSGNGSGFFQGTLRSSHVVGNQASPITGGAVANAEVVNCTVISNFAFGVIQTAANLLRVTNSIVYYNLQDYSGGTLAYTCANPLASGIGNISNAPQLQVDGVHLSGTSPCRNAGLNIASETDLLGKAWGVPPSMGCVEWVSAPSFEIQPALNLTNNPGGFAISFKPTGQEPLSSYWYHDGALLSNDGHFAGATSTNLVVRKLWDSDAGNYSVVVSNSFGMVTSQVAQVIMHYVNAAGGSPATPYTTWATAATDIQAAIDTAQAGEVVMVTNGIYSSGGKIMYGDLLNRVVLDKAITVASANGYRYTIIEGSFDPASTNGPLSVRGVWMTNGAVLAGFAVRNGATRGAITATTDLLHSGGGIWAASTSSVVVNCLLSNNVARYAGAGVCNGTIQNSIITQNTADWYGGGAYSSTVRNCTVYYNLVKYGGGGAGTYNGTVRNSIVVQNHTAPFGFPENNDFANYYLGSGSGSSYSYCFTYPVPTGTGNITPVPYYSVPSFLDAGFHLPAQSPCRGTGSSLYATGEDMDGEVWANPPSMGADEVVDANLAGPISLSVNAWQTNTLVGAPRFLNLWDSITGRVSRIDWNFGDGVVFTNVSYFTSHAWTNSGTYTVTSTAYNNDNLGGVSASLMVEILPLNPPALQLGTFDSNGFKFTFEAQQTVRYDVQFATNLTPPIVWQPLSSIFYSPGGLTQIADPVWTNASRFYRVLAQ